MKKKNCSEAETGWATAHLSHDTMELYCDTSVLGAQGKAPIRPACARGVRQRSRTWPGQGACHDTNFVSWLGAAFVLQYGCDTSCNTDTVRHDTALGAATRLVVRDTACAHGLGAGCVAIQPVTRPARLRHAHARPRYGRGGGHDMAQRTPRHGAVRAAWAQCPRPVRPT